MKLLIFDSGPLINFSLNGMLSVLDSLKENFEGRFIITEEVKKEVYERHLHISQFEWGALKIGDLVTRRIIEMPESIGISQREIDLVTRELMDCANRSFRTNQHPITIVSDAEISCIALAKIAKEKGHDSMLVIDERTARLLCEDPKNIEKLMSQKLHTNVTMDPKCMNKFQNIKCIRSPELAYVAYKKNLITIKDARALDALINATKFKGAAISWDEIKILKKL